MTAPAPQAHPLFGPTCQPVPVLSSMRVGILGGTGPAGSGLAARLAAAGRTILIGSRSPERAAAACDEIRARWPDRRLELEPASNPEAAGADVVVVATPWDAAAPTAASVADRLAGRVVVSMANALYRVGNELQPLVPPRGSVAAGVQAAAPQALVAAAFHHLPARALADLSTPMEGDVLICSDHPKAVDLTAELVELIPDLRPLQAGTLTSAGPIESFTAVVLELNRRYRARAGIRVTGIRG